MTLAETARRMRAERDPRRPPFCATEWQSDPAFTAQESRIWDQARQRKWIGQLSDRDWARLMIHADEVKDGFSPAALDDLDAPFRVAACLPGDERGCSGVMFGRLRGRALVAFPR